MRIRNWKGPGLVALFTLAAACGEDDLGPDPSANTLSTDEADVVAETVADAVDAILDGEIAANPSVTAAPDGALSLSSVPITTQFEWTRSAECRNGGTVTAEGSGVHVADRETGLVTLDFEGSKTIRDCARARGDLVVTLNGAGTFNGHREKLGGEFHGLQTFHAEGSIAWETSDGRSGECSYEIDVLWDPSTGTKTITGFICDREIDRTVTRDGAPGNRGRDSL